MALTGPEATTPRDESGWIGSWVRADPVRAVGVAMILVSLAWRAQLASRGFLAADDWVLVAQSAGSDLTPGFLFTLYNNHFMPAARLLTWLVTHALGYAYWPYLLLMIVGQALIAVTFHRLLRALLRPGWLLLVPLGMFLFSPLTLEATSWWAVGANMLAMQLAMVLALGAQLKYVRTRRLRHLVSLALSVLLGLLFFEKTLLVVPLVFLFTACLFADGGPVRAVVTTLRRWWASWAVLAAISLGFLAAYLSRSVSSLRQPNSIFEVFSFLEQLLGSTLVPGLFGGPWRWLGAGDGAPVAAPPELGRWLAWTALVALIVVTLRLRRIAARAWVLLGTYLLVVAALLAATRLGSVFSDVAGAVPRYVSDVAVVAALCVGVALLGLAAPAAAPATGAVPPAPGPEADDEPAPPDDPAPEPVAGARQEVTPEEAVVEEAVVEEARAAVPAAPRRGVIHAEMDHGEAPRGPIPTATPAAAGPPPPTPAVRPGDTQRAAAVAGTSAASAAPATGTIPVAAPTTDGATATTPAAANVGPRADASDLDRMPDVLARNRETAAAALAAVLVAAGLGTAWTTARYGDEWATSTSRTYLETARAELAGAPPGTVFFDRKVPGDVVLNLSAPYNQQSRFFQALPDRPVFVTEAENPSVFDDSGRIAALGVDGPSVRPGPEEGCGYKLTDGQVVRMPLNGSQVDWFWVVRVGYLASADATATLRLGDGVREFRVQRGLHQVFFEITGGGDAVDLTLHGPGVTLCTNEVTVGNLIARP
ncbi:hypothetical protein [Micromonospora sp. IBHARD004]|uniref:hypothetical protein n=1 Tax=Micromonospora sp. IBHARD004 TaxID=3457764 RepID=UPI004059BC7A